MPRHSARTHELDRRIGEHCRSARIERGLSLEALAAAMGIAYQQLQKYETGVNRITASRLFLLCRECGVPIDEFFADLGEPLPPQPPRNSRGAVRAVAEIKALPAPIAAVILALVRAIAKMRGDAERSDTGAAA